MNAREILLKWNVLSVVKEIVITKNLFTIITMDVQLAIKTNANVVIKFSLNEEVIFMKQKYSLMELRISYLIGMLIGVLFGISIGIYLSV